MSIYILLLSIIPLFLSKDSDCILDKKVPPVAATLTSCTDIKTDTMNKCCYVSYTKDSVEQSKCRLADGATPQTILTSKATIISELEEGATDAKVDCKTAADVCEQIPNPTNFASCNITEQAYPFSCCFIKTSNSQYCYPVNARYNTTVYEYATQLQTLMNLATLPEITCSTKALPSPTSGSIIKMNIMSIIILFVTLI